MGARESRTAGASSGQVWVFRWDGQSWFQEGSTINGAAAGDELGHALDMPDSVHLVASAPYGDLQGSSDDEGRITAYSLDYSVGIADLRASTTFTTFPQPVRKGLLHLRNLPIGSSLRILDAQGRVLAQRRADQAQLEWTLPQLTSGRYFIEVQDGGTRKVQPLLIRP